MAPVHAHSQTGQMDFFNVLYTGEEVPKGFRKGFRRGSEGVAWGCFGVALIFARCI